jgi:hypothetical protein
VCCIFVSIQISRGRTMLREKEMKENETMVEGSGQKRIV